MQTFCTYLWDSIYINRSGEVFACCHQKPVPYGNIHDAPLSEVVNSARAIRLRKDSLKGELSCYAPCNLLDKELSVPFGREAARINYNSLRRLHLSFGEACNIRCVMCNNPQNHMANPILLDSRLIIRNVDLTPFTTIMLRGGEPLVLRPCLEYMDYLEKVGKRYTILTNGILIDEARAHRLAEHAHSVIVSLNGATKEGHESVNVGSDFERVVENVRRMRRARESLGSSLILVGHMTVTTSNLHEIPMFLRLFREFGFDRVNFGYVKETVPPYLMVHPEFAKKLREETHAAMAEVNELDVDPLRLKQLGLWQDPRAQEISSSGLMLQLLPMMNGGPNDAGDRHLPQIGDPVLKVLRETDNDSRVVAFIRHSEREKGSSPAQVGLDQIPLTEKGMELARRFGRQLPPFNHTSLSHTSIIRSVQTAKEIQTGLLESRPDSNPVLKGKDSAYSVVYRGTIDKNLRDLCRVGLRGQAFIQMWLNGDVPANIMHPARETVEVFLADVEKWIRQAPPGSIHIHVGHDREIEVVRTVLWGGHVGDFPMMDFLDGLVFYSKGDGPSRVRWRDRTVEFSLGQTPKVVSLPEDSAREHAI